MAHRGALLPLALVLAAGPLAGCSGDDGPADTGTGPADTGAGPADTGADAPDAGPADTGPVDTGPRDCSGNPFMCAENQSMDANCVCLESCEGGLRWNAATGMCEEPPAGQCNTAQDCAPGEACLNVPQNGGLEPCSGEATCRCLLECDPWVRFTQSGCPPAYDFGQGNVSVACTWLGTDDTLPDALCLPQGMGGEQGASCTADPQCNRQKNFVCLGDTQTSPGNCTRFCDATLTADLCATLDEDLECVPLGVPDLPELGACSFAPAYDVGTTCTSSTTCQGELCAQVLLGSCSQPCATGQSLCEPGAICVGVTGAPMGEEELCMQRCASPDATGDAECQMRNPVSVCRALLGPMNPPICTPPCNLQFGCQPGTMCNPASGRCE